MAVEDTTKLGDLLKKIEEVVNSTFPAITRTRVACSIDTALRVVERIGQSRSPKFRIDDNNRFLYENFIRWICADEAMLCIDPVTREVVNGDLRKGIYIAGGTGTGKSWCLDIMSAFCSIDNLSVGIGSMRIPLRWRSYRTDKVCDDFAEYGSLAKYKDAPIVGFHDLGAEPAEAMHMGNRLHPMREILESRGDCADKLTLITSNLSFAHETFTARYGDRCASRLYEMCNYFEIKGQDRRKQQML